MSRPGHMEPLVGPVEGPTAGQVPHALTEYAPHRYRALRTGLRPLATVSRSTSAGWTRREATTAAGTNQPRQFLKQL